MPYAADAGVRVTSSTNFEYVVIVGGEFLAHFDCIIC